MDIHTQSTFTPIIVIVICSIAIAIYINAVIQQYRHFRQWSWWRSSWFITGVLLLAIAFFSPLGRQAHHDISSHMLQHLLIGMLAPIALVMSAPVSLLLRSLPNDAARSLVQIFHSRYCYLLVHPVVALLLNIGGMYLLYLTPLYLLSLDNTVIHYLVHWHFLAAGYLFVWSLIGPDPVLHRSGFHFRVVILFVSIAAHAILAKLMYAQLLPHGAGYTAADIQRAAKLMYYGGDMAELIVAFILFGERYRVSGYKSIVSYIKTNTP